MAFTISTEYHGIRSGSKAQTDADPSSWQCANVAPLDNWTDSSQGTGFSYTPDAGHKAAADITIWVDDVRVGRASFDLDSTGYMSLVTGAASLAEGAPNQYTLTCPVNAKLKYEIKIHGKLASDLVTTAGIVYAGAGGQARIIQQMDDRTADKANCL